jgi:hypothetical protein
MSDAKKGQNFLFYKNAFPCKPDGVMIDEMHTNWFGAFDLLGMYLLSCLCKEKKITA